MRVAVVCAPTGDSTSLLAMAGALSRELQAKGITVAITEAKAGEAHRLAGYDYIIVGTEPVGLRGRIPRRLSDFLAQTGTIQGKRSMAFVRKRGIGSARALRRLMAAMESEGMIVNFALVLSGIQEATEAAREAPIERN